jgi:hypothetical protein
MSMEISQERGKFNLSFFTFTTFEILIWNLKVSLNMAIVNFIFSFCTIDVEHDSLNLKSFKVMFFVTDKLQSQISCAYTKVLKVKKKCFVP